MKPYDKVKNELLRIRLLSEAIMALVSRLPSSSLTADELATLSLEELESVYETLRDVDRSMASR